MRAGIKTTIWAAAGLAMGWAAGGMNPFRDAGKGAVVAEESAERSGGPEENPHLDDVANASPEEFEKLAATLSGEPGSPLSVDQALALRELALRWIGEDPEGLVEKLGSHLWIVPVWAEEEGAGLLDSIRGKVGLDVSYSVLMQLSKTAPMGVVEEYRQQLDGSQDGPVRTFHLTESLSNIAKRDPLAAIALIEEFSGKVEIRASQIA